MRLNAYKFLAKLTTVATILSSVMIVMPARAAVFTNAKDTMTRVADSTPTAVTADHSVVFTLPASFDFDRAGNTDYLRVDFDETSGFTESGTWATTDFTFNDGTARTINAVEEGAGDIDCTVGAGVNNVCISIDTTNLIFTIKPSADYTAGATGATVTFGILGAGADGTLINPSAAGSYTTTIAQCDEAANCATFGTTSHSTTIAVGIADDDQVTVTATVDPSLTFDLDVGTAVDSSSAPTYTVALGTLTAGAVTTSDAGSPEVNMIGMDIDTNAGGGVVVTVRSGSATGLCSTSVPGDCIEFNAGGTIAAGTEDYGICVYEVQNTSSVAAFTAAAAFDADSLSAASGATDTSGTCDFDSHNTGSGTLSNTAQTIVSTTDGIAGGRAEIFVKAAISAVTPAHSDYTDTLTFVATATF